MSLNQNGSEAVSSAPASATILVLPEPEIIAGAFALEKAFLLDKGDGTIAYGWLPSTGAGAGAVAALHQAHQTRPDLEFMTMTSWRFGELGPMPPNYPAGGRVVARLNVLLAAPTSMGGLTVGVSIWFDVESHRLLLEAIYTSRQLGLLTQPPTSLNPNKLFRQTVWLRMGLGLSDLGQNLDRFA